MMHWLVLHLAHILTTGIFLSGAVVMPDFTAPSAGADEGGEPSGNETQSDSGEGSGDETSGEGDEASGEGGEGKETQPTGKTEETKIDWRTVPQNVKNHIQALAKTDKTLSNAIQNAVYTSQSMLREFPGGLKEAQALKNTVEEMGGVAEIQTIKDKYTSFVEAQEDLDARAAQGDPEVLTNFVEVAGKEGFSKLMPAALDQWANMDNESYSHVISRVMVNAMKEGGLVSELNTAVRMLGLKTPEATAEAMEGLKRVAEWANGINKVAMTPPAKPKVDPNIQSQQEQLDARSSKIFNDEFSSEFGTWRNREIMSQIKTVSNNRQLSDYQLSTLGQKIVAEVQGILTSDLEYMKNLRKIYDSKNMGELQKFTRSRTSKLLPEVTRKAYRQLFSDPVSKKNSQKPGDKGTTKTADKGGQPTTSAAAPQGWAKVDAAKAPSPDEIDNNATEFSMKFRKQAILKDGRKVYWGTHVPK